jgi:hypothetical protein
MIAAELWQRATSGASYDVTPVTDTTGAPWLNPGAVIAIAADTSAPRYGRSASGYGSRIPTRYRVTLCDGRVRRVYVMAYGNSGSAYVTINGRPVFLDIATEHALGAL